jgi:hypothetical protein
MRLLVDEIIADLKHKISEQKSLRRKLLLQKAVDCIEEFKRECEK